MYVIEAQGQIYGPFQTEELARYWVNGSGLGKYKLHSIHRVT